MCGESSECRPFSHSVCMNDLVTQLALISTYAVESGSGTVGLAMIGREGSNTG